jgi:hypothetical protein
MDGLRRQTARLANRSCMRAMGAGAAPGGLRSGGRGAGLCDIDGWFVRHARSQAFNTKTSRVEEGRGAA